MVSKVMSVPDLNLLVTLDALLAEASVARAARRLRLSPSAMSRALARLRDVTGDPLLVRAGRGLVPTPRALALREEVSLLVRQAQAALRPAAALDLLGLRRSFTLRVADGFVETVGPALLARLGREAPGLRLRFMTRTDQDSALLRDGSVDLETGVISPTSSPELLTQALFRDHFVGVVRHGHPLAVGTITPERYAAGGHILVTRRSPERGAPDDALAPLGLDRDIIARVDGFAAALALARSSDLIATVPALQTGPLRAGMHSFVLPMVMPDITVSLLWHPRLDADLAHRWLRDCVRTAYAEVAQGSA